MRPAARPTPPRRPATNSTADRERSPLSWRFNGVDEAITSEPSEERCSRALTRTERVQPVIAGADEWSVAVAAGKQGGIAGDSSSLRNRNTAPRRPA
jgi:hypothetical protein